MKARFVVLASLALLMTACNPQASSSTATATPSPSTAPSGVAPLKISGNGTEKQPARFIQQRGNRKQYELIARSYVTNVVSGRTRASFRVVHVTFFDKNGTQLIADAPRAYLDQTSNVVELTGGVTAHNTTGMTLRCDTLTYDGAMEMIHGTGHVAITDVNGLRAIGNRFDSNITLTQTRMQ